MSPIDFCCIHLVGFVAMKTTARSARPARLADLVGDRTVRDLADRLDCHFTHVSNILIGKRSPSTHLLEKLARELHTPMQALHSMLVKVQKERRQRERQVSRKRQSYRP